MKRVLLTFSMVLFASAVANAQSGSPHYTPSKVTIKPEKTELMPGEEIDLVLTDFVDYGGSFVGEARMVRVRAEKGSIWNLHTWVRDSGYMFQIGSGEIVVKYRAPVGEGKDVLRVDVIVTNVHHLRDPTSAEEGDALTIGEQELEVITVDNGKMKYHEYYRNEQGKVPSVTDITVIVGLHFEILKPDHPSATVPLGGFGVGVPYRVTSATVYSASGSYTGEKCSYRLESATPANWNTAIMVYNDQNGAIESVKLPLIAAMLNWVGDGECVPPEEVTIGPVTEWDDESGHKELETLADEMEVDMQTDNRGINIAQIMQMQQAIKQVVVHPDYMAKIQISRDHAGNEARFEDSGDGWQLKKELSWEIEREISPVPLVKK